MPRRKSLVIALSLTALTAAPALSYAEPGPAVIDVPMVQTARKKALRYRKLNQLLKQFAREAEQREQARLDQKLARELARTIEARRAQLDAVSRTGAKPAPLPAVVQVPTQVPSGLRVPSWVQAERPVAKVRPARVARVARVDGVVESDADPLIGQ